MQPNGNSKGNISFAEFELDTEHRRLLREGSPLPLYAKTFDLLAFLVSNNGRVLSKDEILGNVGLYWFTGAIGSSFWPYYARQHAPDWPIPDGRTVDVPMGYCEFPGEIVRPPRSPAAQTFTDIRRWSVMPRGGHFAAMEQPDALAEEIRAFYRPLR